MNISTTDSPNASRRYTIAIVCLFWIAYVGITLAIGFGTALFIHSEVWQLIAWGFISSAGLVALSGLFLRVEKPPRSVIDLSINRSSLGNFLTGLLIGVVSFGIHVGIVSMFAGPVRFEAVTGIGVTASLIFFARFLATSCMEELGFRGFALSRLLGSIGMWPSVCLTSLVFGLSHLLYGWDIQTILLGVIPGGFLWGMSAVATRGIAMPIGLHAAWNFAGWSAGSRKEVGLLKMIIDDNALELTQTVGAISYLSIFGSLTVAFWIFHKRQSKTST